MPCWSGTLSTSPVSSSSSVPPDTRSTTRIWHGSPRWPTPTSFQMAATSSRLAGVPTPKPPWPDQEEIPRMSNAGQVQWQPISQMPLIAGMIDDSLDDTRDHLTTRSKARTQPHVLDDATIDRVEQVH